MLHCLRTLLSTTTYILIRDLTSSNCALSPDLPRCVDDCLLLPHNPRLSSEAAAQRLLPPCGIPPCYHRPPYSPYSKVSFTSQTSSNQDKLFGLLPENQSVWVEIFSLSPPGFLLSFVSPAGLRIETCILKLQHNIHTTFYLVLDYLTLSNYPKFCIGFKIRKSRCRTTLTLRFQPKLSINRAILSAHFSAVKFCIGFFLVLHRLFL